MCRCVSIQIYSKDILTSVTNKVELVFKCFDDALTFKNRYTDTFIRTKIKSDEILGPCDVACRLLPSEELYMSLTTELYIEMSELKKKTEHDVISLMI